MKILELEIIVNIINKQFAEGVLSQSRLDTNTENRNSFYRPG